MAPQELEGETLGEKHRNYNKRLRESQHFIADKDDSDIEKLLKIDIACNNKDVEYILNILKSEDMLYVSRALARCTWLYTDKEYANIINPDYLRSEIFPNMITKAIIKFKKQIRRNIKDENRAEQFYLNETNKIEACKWLPYCSVTFIENNIEKHVKASQLNQSKHRLFKRLCEISISIFEVILKHLEHYERRQYLQSVTFLLNTNVDKYLDVLENSKYQYPKLNHKATDLIMKHSKARVTQKIENYASVVHIPTFVKYLDKEEVKNLLRAESKKSRSEIHQYRGLSRLFEYDTLKYFIYKLPKEEQFEFVKKICLHLESEDVESLQTADILDTDPYTTVMKKIIDKYSNEKRYVWYQFAPFDYAFNEITKLISQNVESYEKTALFSVLIKCAKCNLEHIRTILEYYVNTQKNENESSKMDFVTQVIKHTHVTQYNENSWNILNKILKSINIYEPSTSLSSCNQDVVNFIIIYNALNDQETPEVIKNSFTFSTLKPYKTKMNQAQRDKIFSYLYEDLKSKVSSSVAAENDFTDSIQTISNILMLLRDWDKTLSDYPIVLNKIRELIKLKKAHSYKASLSCFYNIKKSWRKNMFEESIALKPSEEVCLNALKHEPQLFQRHSEEMNILKMDDTVSLKRFLAKLRIYWPQSLAQEWTEDYLNNIHDTKGQTACLRGLVSMLPQQPLLNIIEKYKPLQPKINWKEADDRVINVQRILAKNMHRGRPQPTPDAILSYAKGDYLQFALPSLLAIFYNVKFQVVREYIPKLLDTPVSLQKHGIRLAFKKLDHEELKTIFLNSWKTSKNATIRAIIFKYTHTLLCNEKDATKAAGLWELLEIFIDNLTFTENKDIYKLFSDVNRIPMNVRARYLVKSYNFLQKLIPKLEENDRSHYQWITSQLVEHTRTVMETINPDFMTNLIQEFINQKYFNFDGKCVPSSYHPDDMVQVISAFILCSKNEDEQIQKYENVFVPLMRRSFEEWGQKSNGTYMVRKKLDNLLTRFSSDLKDYVAEKKLMIPLKMYTLILHELEKNLPVTENYILLTKWKLTVALTKLAQEHSGTEDNNVIPFEFGKICLEYLKKDVELHFPCIYVLFSRCVRKFLHLISPGDEKLKFYNAMLSDKDFIQGYLAIIDIGLDSRRDKKYAQIWNEIVAQPSVEVKMHYYNKVAEKDI